jgi:hypothetical protein
MALVAHGAAATHAVRFTQLQLMRVISGGGLRLGRVILNEQQAADVLTFPQLGMAANGPQGRCAP